MPGKSGLTLRHYRVIEVIPGRPESVEEELDEDYTGPLDERDTTVGPDEDEEEDDVEVEPEEREDVVFLSQGENLLLFSSAEALATFVQSNEKHSFSEIEAFTKARHKITTELLVPSDDDHYELDLVVKNLRGGPDVWDADLIISAGEIARDVAQACDLTEVSTALAPGSPLDELDDALRKGGFWARRRMRKLGTETVSIGWRGVIGKIATITEVRD
ncbi:MAG: hypothetical protein HOQ05_01610 [Corynebacteriales bacterium]|nr:hypothetical protein [Mycobacteriales bacterium]